MEPRHCSCGQMDWRPWGRAPSGRRRLRCGYCGRTRVIVDPLVRGRHRTSPIHQIAQDMAKPLPLSCRALGQKLGVSHVSVWRWRIAILRRWSKSLPHAFGETSWLGRESRKGSREWAHAKANHGPTPPRTTWKDAKLPLRATAAKWIIQTRKVGASCSLACGYAVEPRAVNNMAIARISLNWRGNHGSLSGFLSRFRGPSTRYVALYLTWAILSASAELVNATSFVNIKPLIHAPP